ncbi:MAG: phosphoglucosamine mutase [Verrucomicrobiia bacterium]
MKPLPHPPHRQFFGTDGIRGPADQYPLTQELIYQLGRATAHLFRRNFQSPHILIGRDTRQSGLQIEQSLVKGLTSLGAKVGLLGVVPTSAVAYLIPHFKADGGIAITASHNSYEDNGIKFFRHDGYKLDDSLELKLEQETLQPTSTLNPVSLGQTDTIPEAASLYCKFAQSTLPKSFSLQGLTIALDAAHGAAYQTSPEILQSLGAKVHVFNAQPTGININENCGSTYPEKLQDYVKQTQADVGISHDGDADRVIFCDDRGEILDGDEILAIAAIDLLQKNALKNKTLVTTVMSNLGLDQCLAQHGGRVIRAAVGDRYVIEAMIQNDCNLGGEPSGHLIFRDYVTTGDGIISALQILRLIKESGKSLHDLKKILTRFPQKLINIKVKEKKPLEQMPRVQKALQEAEKELGSQGRILLRYSGTEPKIRLLIESAEETILTRLEKNLVEPIKKEIGI